MAKQTKNIDEYVAGLESKTSVTGSESVLINDGGTNKSVSATNLVSGGIHQIERFDYEGRLSLEYLTEVGEIPIYNDEIEKTSLVSVSSLLYAFFNTYNTLGIQKKLTGIYEWYDNEHNAHIDEDAPVIFPNGIAFSYGRNKDGSLSDYAGISFEDGRIVIEPDVEINEFLHATEIYANFIESEFIRIKKETYESTNGELIKIDGVPGSANEVYNTAGRYTEVYSKSEIDELLKNLKESLTTK